MFLQTKIQSPMCNSSHFKYSFTNMVYFKHVISHKTYATGFSLAVEVGLY